MGQLYECVHVTNSVQCVSFIFCELYFYRVDRTELEWPNLMRTDWTEAVTFLPVPSVSEEKDGNKIASRQKLKKLRKKNNYGWI